MSEKTLDDAAQELLGDDAFWTHFATVQRENLSYTEAASALDDATLDALAGLLEQGAYEKLEQVATD
jgi:hypothetical protein